MRFYIFLAPLNEFKNVLIGFFDVPPYPVANSLASSEKERFVFDTKTAPDLGAVFYQKH